MVNQTIKSLRTDGRRIQAMMSHADDTQKAAYSFLNAVNNNNVLPGLNNGIDSEGNRRKSTNEFSKAYSDALRNLGSTKILMLKEYLLNLVVRLKKELYLVLIG